MKGLLKSAKWELRQGGSPAIFLLGGLIAICGMPVVALLESQAMFRVWCGMGIQVIFVMNCAASFIGWSTGPARVLERTAGRPAWQSLGGKVLAWGVLLAVGEGMRPGLTALYVERSRVMLAFAEENGLDVFSPDKAAPWLGWDAFGLSLLLGLTVCLWVAAFSALMAGGAPVSRTRPMEIGTTAALAGVALAAFWFDQAEKGRILPVIPCCAGISVLCFLLTCLLLEKRSN